MCSHPSGDTCGKSVSTWLKMEGDSMGIVGVTQHAQAQLGDVVYAQPPEVGATVKQGEVCGVIESVKTVADVHAPASGVVLEVNPALADTPEAVNTDPYGAWLFRLKLSAPSELAALLDAGAYDQIADD